MHSARQDLVCRIEISELFVSSSIYLFLLASNKTNTSVSASNRVLNIVEGVLM